MHQPQIHPRLYYHASPLVQFPTRKEKSPDDQSHCIFSRGGTSITDSAPSVSPSHEQNGSHLPVYRKTQGKNLNGEGRAKAFFLRGGGCIKKLCRHLEMLRIYEWIYCTASRRASRHRPRPGLLLNLAQSLQFIWIKRQTVINFAECHMCAKFL